MTPIILKDTHVSSFVEANGSAMDGNYFLPLLFERHFNESSQEYFFLIKNIKDCNKEQLVFILNSLAH